MNAMRTDSECSFHLQQDDLAVVCAERELRTRERHCVNDVYGQASVLKRYARVPESFPLRAIIEHGVFISGKMMEYDREAWLPVALCPSPRRAAFVGRVCGKQTVAIGFSYLYAMRLFHRLGRFERPVVPRRGCVVFPVHSTSDSAVHFDHDDYARKLADLPDRFHPVVVCMYWKDVHHGHHQAYLRQGLQVVSAGHMYDRDFLLRFYDICRRFRYAAANFIGTNLFLSVASGCRFFYVHSGPIKHQFSESDRKDASLDDPIFQRIQSESLQLFGEPTERMTIAQRAFVDGHLGTACVRSPTALAAVLINTRLRDLFCPIALDGQSGWSTCIPLSWRRKMRSRSRIDSAAPDGEEFRVRHSSDGQQDDAVPDGQSDARSRRGPAAALRAIERRG